MSEYQIARLGAEHAAAIASCFARVYGNTYANEIFNHPARLRVAMESGSIASVGALDGNGRVLAHMAMTRRSSARHIELGNTIVDPVARGSGLAWQVGNALTQWCIDLGYKGYLHYPTTDHPVMQRQSVQSGHETGLMLGYIPTETDSGMNPESRLQRGGATIVYEELSEQAGYLQQYLPERYEALIRQIAAPTRLRRQWQKTSSNISTVSLITADTHEKRSLCRLNIEKTGRDLTARIEEFVRQPYACRQIDFNMSDPGIGLGIEMAVAVGARFCGWLPGLWASDVLRLQWLEPAHTDTDPDLINPVARYLLAIIQKEQSA